MGVSHQHDDDYAIEDGKISHHAYNGFLLGTFDMGGADEFRGVPKLRAGPGCGDDRRGFSAPYQRPGVSFETRSGFDGDGLAGEHGLVEQDRALDQLYVGCNHSTERQLYPVAWHQFSRGYILPAAVALHRSRKSEPRFQRGKSSLCASLLEKPEHSVEYQEPSDDGSLDIFVKRCLEDDRGFKHPWDRRPKLGQRHTPCRYRRVRHCVWAVFC